MIRDFLTTSIVSLTLLGTAPLQDGDSFALQLLAATGDARRTLCRFLDLYACLKAGAPLGLANPDLGAGWSDFA